MRGLLYRWFRSIRRGNGSRHFLRMVFRAIGTVCAPQWTPVPLRSCPVIGPALVTAWVMTASAVEAAPAVRGLALDPGVDLVAQAEPCRIQMARRCTAAPIAAPCPCRSFRPVSNAGGGAAGAASGLFLLVLLIPLIHGLILLFNTNDLHLT